MSQEAQQVLTAFEALTLADQREVAVFLLRRTIVEESGDMPEEALLAAADSLFQDLDQQEAENAES